MRFIVERFFSFFTKIEFLPVYFKMFGVLLYALHDRELDFRHAWFCGVFHQPPIEFSSYNLV